MNFREEAVLEAPDRQRPVARGLAQHRDRRVQVFQRVEEAGRALHVDDAGHVSIVVVLRLLRDALRSFLRPVNVLAARPGDEPFEGLVQVRAAAARHVDERADSRVRSERAPRRLFVEVFHQGGARVAQLVDRRNRLAAYHGALVPRIGVAFLDALIRVVHDLPHLAAVAARDVEAAARRARDDAGEGLLEVVCEGLDVVQAAAGTHCCFDK